ncbi:MAG: hypothetical protein J6I84_06760 [Bacilli bacterium]|nr:hypothetical protein [Bacilli bacterium]
MKKRLVALMTIFAALSLAACNGGNNANQSTAKPASTSQKPSSSKEVWGEWKVVTPATCNAPGKEERTSDLGNKQEREIPKLKQHTWTATEVAASGEGVAYENIECSVCHAKGLRVATSSATIEGTDKGGAPAGCIKLSSKGEYMEVKINIPEAKSGKVYLTGAMDYWHDGSNNNEGKSFSSVKDSANTCNFKLEVNGAEVDPSANLTKTFGEMLPEEAGETVGSVTYSQIGDCEVGAVALVAGANTFKFTRIDSYNLAVKYFTVVFAA